MNKSSVINFNGQHVRDNYENIKKIGLFIICGLCCTYAYTQRDEELSFDFDIDSSIVGKDICETASNMARKDFQNGKYAAFFHGYKQNFSLTFERIMLREYGIHALRTGLCMGDEFLSCYSETSIPLIKDKFGDEIFNIAMQKSKVLDSIGKGDRNALSSEDLDELVKLFYCNISKELVKKYCTRKNYQNVNLSFDITTEGEIINFQVSNCDNEELIEEINRISQELPIVQYATSDGEPVVGKGNLNLFFNRKKIKKCS